MGNLIKNEFIKIFRKKSTYIVLIILAVFVILTNCIYKYMMSAIMPSEYRANEDYIQYSKEQLKGMTPESNREEYIRIKSEIELYELQENYSEDSWQMFIINRDFYTYIENINKFKYGTESDKAQFTENPEEVYNRELNRLNSSDWKQYAKEEIAQIEGELAIVKGQKELAENSSSQKEFQDTIKVLETRLELAKMRIEKDIPYGLDYINTAIEKRIALGSIDYDYNNPKLTYQEKVNRQQDIENYEKSKYIIDNKQDIDNYSSVRGVLLNMFNEYSIFLVIFVVMIAGGIVSSEIEKGTIKILLVKPYKRWKILLAKYIVSMIMILFIFAVTILMQIIIGGIIFGFDSLSIPAVVYNFDTNSLETYNLFAYVGLIALTKLPIYILLGTLAFAISCIFGNTVLAIVLPIIGNIAGTVIRTLLEMRPIKQLAAFPTLNYDFQQFLFGHLPAYEFTNIRFASIICIVYLVAMIIVSWFAFNKKEIKNV